MLGVAVDFAITKRVQLVCSSPAPHKADVSATVKPLGLIAGSRELPLTIARQVASMDQRPIVAVGFTDETNPVLERSVSKLEWVRVGQLSKLIKAFKDNGVTECVMAGQVA